MLRVFGKERIGFFRVITGTLPAFSTRPPTTFYSGATTYHLKFDGDLLDSSGLHNDATTSGTAHYAAQEAAYAASQGYLAWTTDHIAASHRHNDAQKRLHNATRPVQPGDLVEVTGSVKKQEVSKFGRPQTVLTRCSLRYLPEVAQESK